MRRARGIFLAILLSAAGVRSYAQQQDTTYSEVEEDIERALEDIDPEDAEFDGGQLAEFLQELAANPLNLNRAGIDDLLQIPAVHLAMARNIVSYRRTVKPFESIEELTRVSGIGPATLAGIRPYVIVGSGLGSGLLTNPRYWINNSKVEIFSRYQQSLEEEAGYTHPGGYRGSPVKYYQRFRYTSDRISATLTQEKDPGETLAGVNDFDHHSWHVALNDVGILRRLVIGDYSLSFGQGLVLWNGGMFGKGREVISAANKKESGIRPYASAREFGYYNGVAATVGRSLQFSGFYSKTRESSTLVTPDTSRFPGGTGLHRTETELARKNNLEQTLYGGRVRYELPAGFVGVSGYRVAFDKYVAPSAGLHNLYAFEGTGTTTFSADYRLLLGSSVLYGEVARSENNSYGFVTGIESRIDEKTELSMTYRNYFKDFWSPFGAGFGEQSGSPANEEGFYMGIRYSLNEQVAFSAFFDRFRFPAPRFRTTRPTGGYEWLGLAEFAIDRNLTFYLQARSKIREEEFETVDEAGRAQRRAGKSQRTSLRAHLDYWINRRIRWRTRGEIVRNSLAGEEAELGYLIYQDLRVLPASRWRIDARISIFDTQGFNSRVYQFENDLLYVFSSTVLFNRGQRFYLLVNYEPSGFLDLWAKFGVTAFEDTPVLGSGLTETEGNRRSEIGLQARIRF